MCSDESEQELVNKGGDPGLLAEKAISYGGALEGGIGTEEC